MPFFLFFPKSTWKSHDSCLRETTDPGGLLAQSDEEEHTPAELSSVHQENLLLGHPKQLETPPKGTDSPRAASAPAHRAGLETDALH